MPHFRARHVYALLQKRLVFFRVVSIHGARQTGKSFLAREILTEKVSNAVYLTFDKPGVKDRAARSPETFLLEHEDHKPIIIDEAQKVPDIFDAVKARVDVDTKPGQFVLLGSTEFSKELKIKESLTGRLGRIRLYPFNLAESLQLPPNPAKSFDLVLKKPRTKRKDLLRYLNNGGFPGIFFVHGAEERHALLEDWLNLVLERDLHQFPNFKADSSLARSMVELLATSENPSAESIGKKLRQTTQKVTRYLNYLNLLFVVHKLRPHRLGSGKSHYLLCDVGLVAHLQATRERLLRTWILLEAASQHAYRGSLGVDLTYYRSSRGGIIDLVIETRESEIAAFKCLDRETIDRRDLEILKSFGVKCKKDGYKTVNLYALAPVDHLWKEDGVTILPWESLG